MKTYSNRDFYLSSYLISNGCDLLDTKVESGITTFLFEKDEKVERLIARYYSLKSRVEPMAYGQAIRTLKSVIHASKSNSKSEHNYEFYNKYGELV